MPVNETADYGVFVRTSEQFDKEILYSMAPPPLEKGGFLKLGQGPCDSGQVLDYEAATGKWIKTVDGTAAAGILANGADSTARDVAINVYLRGAFKSDKLVGLNAAAITKFAARQPAATGVGGAVGGYNVTIIP